jgi:hypothetical protein
LATHFPDKAIAGMTSIWMVGLQVFQDRMRTNTLTRSTGFFAFILIVTPAAAYVSIKQYVPFSSWLSISYTDAHLRGVSWIQNSGNYGSFTLVM